VPWCAAFVGAVLADSGVEPTGSLLARSYLDWGDRVDLDAARPGDVVIFWRGRRDGWQGHVGFLAEPWGGTGTVKVLGGNQGDQVNVAGYDAGRVLGVRRASGGFDRTASVLTGSELTPAERDAIAAVRRGDAVILPMGLSDAMSTAALDQIDRVWSKILESAPELEDLETVIEKELS
jgi:TIGR02594 family protein